MSCKSYSIWKDYFEKHSAVSSIISINRLPWGSASLSVPTYNVNTVRVSFPSTSSGRAAQLPRQFLEYWPLLGKLLCSTAGVAVFCFQSRHWRILARDHTTVKLMFFPSLHYVRICDTQFLILMRARYRKKEVTFLFRHQTWNYPTHA